MRSQVSALCFAVALLTPVVSPGLLFYYLQVEILERRDDWPEVAPYVRQLTDVSPSQRESAFAVLPKTWTDVSLKLGPLRPGELDT